MPECRVTLHDLQALHLSQRPRSARGRCSPPTRAGWRPEAEANARIGVLLDPTGSVGGGYICSVSAESWARTSSAASGRLSSADVRGTAAVDHAVVDYEVAHGADGVVQRALRLIPRSEKKENA